MSYDSDRAYERVRETTRNLFKPDRNNGHAFTPIEDLSSKCQKCLKRFSIIAIMEGKLPLCEVA